MFLFEVNFEGITATTEQRRSFTEIIGLGSEVDVQSASTGGDAGQSFEVGKLKSGVLVLRHAFRPDFQAYYQSFEREWTSKKTSSASVVIYDQDGTTVVGSFKHKGAKIVGVGVPVLSKDERPIGEIKIAYTSCSYSSGGAMSGGGSGSLG